MWFLFPQLTLPKSQIVSPSTCSTIEHTGGKKQGSMLLQTCQSDAYVSAIAPFLYRFSSASSRTGSSSFIWPPKPDKSCEQCKLLHAKICEASCGQARSRQHRDSIPPQLGHSSPRLDHKALGSIVHSLACYKRVRWPKTSRSWVAREQTQQLFRACPTRLNTATQSMLW